MFSFSSLLLLEVCGQHVHFVQLLQVFNELFVLLHRHCQEHVSSEIEDRLLSVSSKIFLLVPVLPQLDYLVLQLVQTPYKLVHILQLVLELSLQHQQLLRQFLDLRFLRLQTFLHLSRSESKHVFRLL